MRIAVCDDEPLLQQEVTTRLDYYAKDRLLDIQYDCYPSGEDLLNIHKDYDIIFLDYQMKSKDGMQTAREIRERNKDVAIIFLTNYPEIVYDAFVVNAFRFLLKPIDDQKLYSALDDYRKNSLNDKYLTFKASDGIVHIRIKDIIYVETNRNYSLIHTAEQIHTCRQTCSFIEEQLAEYGFFRCHRFFLINLAYISILNSKRVKMSNGDELLVSRSQATALKEAYFSFNMR